MIFVTSYDCIDISRSSNKSSGGGGRGSNGIITGNRRHHGRCLGLKVYHVFVVAYMLGQLAFSLIATDNEWRHLAKRRNNHS